MGSSFVKWQSVEILAVSLGHQNEFHTAVPQGWDHKPKLAHSDPTLVLISFLEEHSHSSGMRLRKRIGRMEEIVVELMTLVSLYVLYVLRSSAIFLRWKWLTLAVAASLLSVIL